MIAGEVIMAERDLISRQAAIDAVKRLSLGETDATRLAMRIGDYLERLPSAQPELIEKTAYIRGFEQGRTQGMIDSQGGKDEQKGENRMTKDRALEVLEVYASVNGSGRCTQDEFEEAKKMAIEALSNSEIPNNSDCISRQAAIDKFKALLSGMEYVRNTDEAKERVARGFFADIPSSDSVEVVRCKDCKKREHCRTTNTWAVAPSDDWFCADGERAEK